VSLRQAEAPIPGRLKLGAKIVLARLPMSHGLWQKRRRMPASAPWMLPPSIASEAFPRPLEDCG